MPIQKLRQAAVMPRRDVEKASTGVPACGMGQCECAVDQASGFKLTLDLGPASGQRGETGENLEALCGEIHKDALTGGFVAVQEAPSVDGDTKVAAWIRQAVPFVIEQWA